MPLDLHEADLVEVARNRVVGAASRRADAQELKFDLMVKVLQRDDPLRRSYLQWRWHAHATSIPLSREMGRFNCECTSLSPIAFSRR
jgi:hypothetical protein